MDETRYLFRAGRKGYAYPEILEVSPGSVQILVPSETARRRTKTVSILVALAYVFLVGPIVATLASLPVPGLWTAIIAGVSFFAGLIGILVWWDQLSLPLLAEAPTSVTGVELVGIQSFGTFQEFRARVPSGDIRIAVSGSRRRAEEAARMAGLSPASS